MGLFLCLSSFCPLFFSPPLVNFVVVESPSRRSLYLYPFVVMLDLKKKDRSKKEQNLILLLF